MAPASASPQPPPDRSDIAPGAGRGRHQPTGEQPDTYGLLRIERHVKDDGRGLIVYARREQEDE